MYFNWNKGTTKDNCELKHNKINVFCGSRFKDISASAVLAVKRCKYVVRHVENRSLRYLKGKLNVKHKIQYFITLYK